ncbi:eCIS core domain-containing protein [Massilia pseudoviolaceinigra]|uniref:eCIS core domain-containing protein n=1 Tax=Massilia pseudoviolaceinigra TaxID=3057165 RepID=UPI0027968E0A|nr:DUF4157 domain-containing protein [Massilia sp. CCM 9206]MDQ1923622.1 DUF4157 domain-containing protein [Massilia sp. CCM 9206]
MRKASEAEPELPPRQSAYQRERPGGVDAAGPGPAPGPASSSAHGLEQLAVHSPRQAAQRAAMSALQESPRMRERAGAVDAMHASARVQAQSTRSGLPGGLRAGMESLSGMSLEHVTVHRNSSRPAQFQAHALAQGAQIHLAPGQDAHLAHEAWHVVQQAQGRVPVQADIGGIGVNTDPALEAEADVMGQRALQAPAGAAVAPGAGGQRAAAASATLQRAAVVQMAKPGPIQHVLNSCFAAALVNVFTVTTSLRNLLDPGANDLSGNPAAAPLQHFLRGAVNSVDADLGVPKAWMRNLMVALARSGVIADATEAEDVNSIITRAVNVLTAGNPRAAQLNNMPVSAGVSVWFPDLSLQQTAGSSVQVLQSQHGDPGGMFPNVIHINRGAGNARPAPPTFALPSNDGTMIDYRLRSAIYRDRGFVGGHFVSYLDRGGDAAAEWWRSDDIEDDTEQVAGLDNVMPQAGNAPQGARGADMSVHASAYIYERINLAAVARHGGPALAAPLDPGVQASFDKAYDRYLSGYKAAHSLSGDVDEALVPRDTASTGKTSHGASATSDMDDGAFRLDPITVSSPLHDEVRRQLTLQLEGLNRMSVEEWLVNTLINRSKTADAVVKGYATAGGVRLAGKIDSLLAGRQGLPAGSGKNEDQDHHALGLLVLDAIFKRMTQLAARLRRSGNHTAEKFALEVAELALAAKKHHAPYMQFVSLGGIRKMETISVAGLSGGIGRQHGDGDEHWFRKKYARGVREVDLKADEQMAVLHNPDQVMGGSMDILHEEQSKRRLDAARSSLIRARQVFDSATSKLSAAKESTVSARVLTKQPGAFKNFFSSSTQQEKAYQPEKTNRVAAAQLVVEQAREALEFAETLYHSLIARHFGGSSANSALGAAWLEELEGPHGPTRLSRLLDHVLADIPMDQWDSTRMNVAMDVHSDAALTRAPRVKSAATRAKKEHAHHNALTSTRKQSAPKKAKDDQKFKRVLDKKTGPSQRTLFEMKHRAEHRASLNGKRKAATDPGANERQVFVIDDDEVPSKKQRSASADALEDAAALRHDEDELADDYDDLDGGEDGNESMEEERDPQQQGDGHGSIDDSDEWA